MNLQEPFWQISSFLLAFFSLQQCTKRLRFLNLFSPYFLLLLSATLTKQFKRDSSHWHFPHKRKQQQKKEFWHLLLGDLCVIRYHHHSQFPLTRLCFMDDRWWTPPLVFHTCRFDIFLTLGHWGRTRWEQDYQILIRGDLSALVSISHNKSAW